MSETNHYSSLLGKIEGVITAINTPLTSGFELDVKGLECLIERLLATGISCIFPLGWNGEGPALTDAVRVEMIRRTCDIVRHRVPVMVGVSEQSLQRAAALVEVSRSANAELVLATPPFSYAIPQELVLEYFESLAGLAKIPLVIYDNGETSVRLHADTLARLSSVPGIVGVKSYAPWQDMQRQFLTIHKPDRFVVISGDEYLYGPALFGGMRHFTMGGPGNVCPAWCARMFEAAVASKWEQVSAMHQRLITFCDTLYAGVETPYAAIKYALQVMGVCHAYISSPHRLPAPPQQEHIRATLKSFADVVAV